MPKDTKKKDPEEGYQRTERWVDFAVGPGGLRPPDQPQVPGTGVAGPSAAGVGGVPDGVLDPTAFDEIAPIPRPDTPEMDEQLAPEATNDNSILGNFMQVMDNVTPDDMGGLLRGTSGWMSNVPGYKETVGRALGANLTAAAGVIDAANWGSQQLDRLIAAAVSAAPGGIQTLTWDQTNDVSTFQAAITSIGLESKRIREGGSRPSDLLLLNPVTLPFMLAGYAADDSPIQQDGFDILDKEQKDKAFSQGWERFFSGLGDAGTAVGTDPFIIFGGASSVLRYGTKGGKFGGFSNQALRTSGQVDRFATTLDDQAALIAELGVDGARSSGRLTNEGENLINAMQKNASDVATHVWVKNNNNPRAAQDLLGRTSIDRPEEAAALVGAMAGRATSWQRLRELNVQMYDDLALAHGWDVVTPVAPRPGSAANIPYPQYSDDTLKIVDDLFDQKLKAPQTAGGEGSQMLTRGGSRGRSTGLVRAANAWRAGAARTQFEQNPFRRTEGNVVTSRNGNWAIDFIEGTSASRPLTVVRWLGRAAPSGVLFLKGDDLASSTKEWTAWLRNSPLTTEQSSKFLSDFVGARTVQDRLRVVSTAEEAVVEAISEQKGLNPRNAMKLYEGYRARRAAAIGQARSTKNKFFIDDQTGEAVKVPDFYAQLDQAAPLMDIKMFSRVADDHRTWLRSREDVTIAADYVNSLWKISVLLRLGYTQRNIVEGALRSFAVLGLAASNPRALASAPFNAPHWLKMKSGQRKIKVLEKELRRRYDNLNESRNALLAARSEAGVDDWTKLLDEAQEVTPAIRNLQRKARTRRGLTNKEQDKLDRLIARRQKKRDMAESIKTERINPAAGRMTELQRQEQQLMREIDEMSDRVKAAMDQVMAADAKRKVGGRGPNRMSDGTELPGAFQGDEGAMAALLSGADRTTYTVFAWGTAARSERLAQTPDFKKLVPSELNPKQMKQYWVEYTTRINNQFRGDPVVRMILEGKTTDEIKSWLVGPQGKIYREELSIKKRELTTNQQVDDYINDAFKRVNTEIPDVGNLRATVLEREIATGELMTALKGRELPSIPGRKVDMQDANVFAKGFAGLNNFTGVAMKWLGTIPENKLLRHPFYNNIYTTRQRELYDLAYKQGLDVTDANVLARLNKSAHRDALKSTRETMYTIERLSNSAEMVRFISPFFSAWENSVRTWGRIAYTKPQVIGYGNLLWNIPNNLGWVVDENGNKVESSSFLRDEKTWIIWPKPMQDLLTKKFGPFTPGQAVMSRQQGMNVIFPGGEWWFAGVGPMVQMPTALVLRGKPEEQEILRSYLGESLYNQVTPFGNVNNSLVDSMMPTIARRWKQMLNGTSSDTAFLTSYNQILEDAYITAQIENRTLTEKDYEQIAKDADTFWRWQILAAGTLPFQSSLMSPYKLQRDKWQALIDDQSIPYQEKIRLFLEDQGSEFFAGEDFAAITRSGSLNETQLNPNLKTWQRITKNKDVVQELYALDPKLVGMFGNMGSWDDPFSYAVYGEYGQHSVDGTGKPVRRRLRPDEIARNNEIADGWRSYWKVKDYLEEKVAAAGLSSLEVDAAKPYKDILDNTEELLKEQYRAWGQERTFYVEMIPRFVQGARIIVQNGDIMEEDSTVRTLAGYMQVRDFVSQKLQDTTDQDAREQLKQIAYTAAFELRQQDIGFADFYDQYLARDDFRKV